MGMSEWNGARQDGNGGPSPGRGRSRDHGPQWDQPAPTPSWFRGGVRIVRMDQHLSGCQGRITQVGAGGEEEGMDEMPLNAKVEFLPHKAQSSEKRRCDYGGRPLEVGAEIVQELGQSKALADSRILPVIKIRGEFCPTERFAVGG